MNNLVARAALVGFLMVFAHSPDARAEDEGQHHMARNYFACLYNYANFVKEYRRMIEENDKDKDEKKDKDISAWISRRYFDGDCDFLQKGWAVKVEPYPKDPLLIYVTLIDQSKFRGRYVTFKDVVE